ncbi:MAG: hypothetical protein ACLFPL_02055 [Candidatus Nanoarchaeia archaeon]
MSLDKKLLSSKVFVLGGGLLVAAGIAYSHQNSSIFDDATTSHYQVLGKEDISRSSPISNYITPGADYTISKSNEWN